MADTNVGWAKAALGWHLLAEIEVKILSQSKASLRKQIGEALEVLNVPLALLERIFRAVTQALEGHERNAGAASGLTTARIRILSSATKSGNAGWGFFLLVKPAGESPAPLTAAPYLLDVYLYQEHGLDKIGR